MNGCIKKLSEGVYEGINNIENKYLQILFKAIVEVGEQYYYTENPESATNETIEQLERIFAYELYYQWSILQSNYNKTIPDEYKRIINGEIRKQMSGINKYPDMVLHKGQYDIHHQEIVVEIKRKVAINGDNVAQDIIKLTHFMSEGFLGCGASPFSMGVLILTNGSENDIKEQLEIIKDESINQNIYCVFCNGDNSLRYITLNEILNPRL